MKITLFYALITVFVFRVGCKKRNTILLPPDLLIGSASSAYQIEGAWNIDGKGENMWDRMTHNMPFKIRDRTNGDVACDSYYKIEQDVALIRTLGLQFYRFSISWSRILPNGFINKINTAGIQYYDKLINRLIEFDIIPVVTIYHWDLPQPLQDLGGWTNPAIQDWFEDFARVLFDNFGDRIKIWITVNEPKQICSLSYSIGDYAPGIVSDGIGNYMCNHNLLKAHARVYHLYDKLYKPLQKGKIGINIEVSWFEPVSNITSDINATKRRKQFEYGIYAHPIFSKKGDYPQIVKYVVNERSKKEGFLRSRLPKFTSEEVKYIKGTSDFFGLNHYASLKVKAQKFKKFDEPSVEKDIGADIIKTYENEKLWSYYFKSMPSGFRKSLLDIKQYYQNPDIYIFETGLPDEGTLKDNARIRYLKESLAAVTSAMRFDGVKVKAFTSWSLMDSFEWLSGYTFGFGLYYVNFTTPERTRVPKSSATFFKNIIRNRKFVLTHHD